MRILYFGTAEFAEEPFRRLLGAGHEVLALVTQPDRPKGRGRKFLPPAIKLIARDQGVKIEQPEDPNAREFVSRMMDLAPDFTVVAAYAHKLGADLLRVPRQASINIHPSVLPLYRGAAPINWAIINGEKTTGVTIIKMNERLDAGEILLQETVGIGDEETAGELTSRLSAIGAELLLTVLGSLGQGELVPLKQDETKVTRAPRIVKSDCEVNWSESAEEIANLIRGLNPKPGAFTYFRGKVVKLSRARRVPREPSREPGEIEGTREGIEVAAGKGILCLLALQPEGKRELSWIDFRNGMRPRPGERFHSGPRGSQEVGSPD